MLSHTYNQAYINNSTMVAVSSLQLIEDLVANGNSDENIIIAVHNHIRGEIRKGCYQAFKDGFSNFGTVSLFSLNAKRDEHHAVRIWRMGNKVRVTHMRPGGYEKKSKELRFLVRALTELTLADEKHVSASLPKRASVTASNNKAA